MKKKKRDFLYIESKTDLEGLNLPNECSIKKESRFIKVLSEDEDLHSTGSTGTVVGSFYNAKKEECYYVIFDNPVKHNGPQANAVIVGIPGRKIAKYK